MGTQKMPKTSSKSSNPQFPAIPSTFGPQKRVVKVQKFKKKRAKKIRFLQKHNEINNLSG